MKNGDIQIVWIIVTMIVGIGNKWDYQSAQAFSGEVIKIFERKLIPSSWYQLVFRAKKVIILPVIESDELQMLSLMNWMMKKLRMAIKIRYV